MARLRNNILYYRYYEIQFTRLSSQSEYLPKNTGRRQTRARRARLRRTHTHSRDLTGSIPPPTGMFFFFFVSSVFFLPFLFFFFSNTCCSYASCIPIRCLMMSYGRRWGHGGYSGVSAGKRAPRMGYLRSVILL